MVIIGIVVGESGGQRPRQHLPLQASSSRAFSRIVSSIGTSSP
jgi:hypothetical protein